MTPRWLPEPSDEERYGTEHPGFEVLGGFEPRDAKRILARLEQEHIPFETDAPDLKVTGELPRELNGTLYRNGPNPQFTAENAHWFVGDGMLHAFHLDNARASYRNR